MPSKLFLIPNAIAEQAVLPTAAWPKELAALRYFFVEEPKSARRLLKQIDPQFPLSDCTFFDLNEHTPEKDVKENFAACYGRDVGIISEAGCPGVADPGAEVVRLAHEEGRDVVPLVGPSSIILALMASGLNGQNFAFVGYLPKDRNERAKVLKHLEKRSHQESQTQIFMETPYRSEQLFDELLAGLDPQTLLCVTSALTAPDQMIKTQAIKEWKKSKPALNKKPTLFLIQRI